ncbi:MAG: hypothetical protein AAB408_01450 [Patescibacteria group bacterium]
MKDPLLKLVASLDVDVKADPKLEILSVSNGRRLRTFLREGSACEGANGADERQDKQHASHDYLLMRISLDATTRQPSGQ